jgi:hypothetical protein
MIASPIVSQDMVLETLIRPIKLEFVHGAFRKTIDELSRILSTQN